jgi:Protein of unknown function (DUF2946)
MPIGRRFRALTSWIACFAILLSALGPTLSHAFGAGKPANWIEICTVTGAKLIRADGSEVAKADATGKSGSDSPGAHLKHCPYCSTHATVLGLPPAAPAGLTLDSLAFHVPDLFLTAPRTLFAWASAQPRAPPLNA